MKSKINIKRDILNKNKHYLNCCIECNKKYNSGKEGGASICNIDTAGDCNTLFNFLIENNIYNNLKLLHVKLLHTKKNETIN